MFSSKIYFSENYGTDIIWKNNFGSKIIIKKKIEREKIDCFGRLHLSTWGTVPLQKPYTWMPLSLAFTFYLKFLQ